MPLIQPAESIVISLQAPSTVAIALSNVLGSTQMFKAAGIHTYAAGAEFDISFLVSLFNICRKIEC
jgi:hypothetical protein